MTLLQHPSVVVLDWRGRWLRALPAEQGRWRIRPDLDRIDPVFVRRLIALEDARFYAHPGIDPVATLRAAAGDLLAGRVRSGGSTLDMQLARRLHPCRRTLWAKLIESLRALQLDAMLGKRGVLAAYLTLTPYGGNLEGVRAASLAWFGHPPDHLDDAEQALLIALPQAPEARRPDRHPDRARTARARVLARLQRARLISPADRALAESKPLPRRQALPALAWHAASELARAAPAGRAEIVSTLDAGLQARLEAMARTTAEAQGPQSQAAILVVEVSNRAVRAAVGSAGLDRQGGWMDLTRSLRSPGSALKPFIYGMAFEGGQAAPDTRVDDGPTAYGGYPPPRLRPCVPRPGDGAPSPAGLAERAGGSHAGGRSGPACSSSACAPSASSWRVPRSASPIPASPWRSGPRGCSCAASPPSTRRSATAGWPSPWPGPKPTPGPRIRQRGRRLLSGAAAEQVLDILRESPPPAGRASALLSADRVPQAFKTGTSYGYRDALAAGVGGGLRGGGLDRSPRRRRPSGHDRLSGRATPVVRHLRHLRHARRLDIASGRGGAARGAAGAGADGRRRRSAPSRDVSPGRRPAAARPFRSIRARPGACRDGRACAVVCAGRTGSLRRCDRPDRVAPFVPGLLQTPGRRRRRSQSDHARSRGAVIGGSSVRLSLSSVQALKLKPTRAQGADRPGPHVGRASSSPAEADPERCGPRPKTL